MSVSAFVSWPSAPLTDSLVLNAIEHLSSTTSCLFKIIREISNFSTQEQERLVQWSTYDRLDHDLIHSGQDLVHSSSYTIRKALIRKHFLHRCVTSYLVKRGPNSILQECFPKTWDVEISFADELDDMWTDELWDLGKDLDDTAAAGTGDQWWILKPGMADGGNGIRLFNSKEALQEIFESFDIEDDDKEGAGPAGGDDSGIVMSQLRHFVIQEYISNTLLIDPTEVPVLSTGHAKLDKSRSRSSLRGHKFHLRVYCVASGALKVYLYSRILVLFSSEPYSLPSVDETHGDIDMHIHLTNTCVQEGDGESREDVVRLLSELAGTHVISTQDIAEQTDNVTCLTEDDIDAINDDIGKILAETFQAALQNPVHFQPLPNAFELFGVDFLLSHPSDFNPQSKRSSRFRLDLLEINAEPAIERTGQRLNWILEDLFCAIGEVCIAPPLCLSVGRDVHGPLLTKCFEEKIRP